MILATTEAENTPESLIYQIRNRAPSSPAKRWQNGNWKSRFYRLFFLPFSRQMMANNRAANIFCVFLKDVCPVSLYFGRKNKVLVGQIKYKQTIKKRKQR